MKSVLMANPFLVCSVSNPLPKIGLSGVPC